MRTIAAILMSSLSAAAHDWNGIAVDAKGNVFVVDGEHGRIWRVAPDGTVDTLVSARDGARLGHPHHLAIDAKGTLWVPGG